MAKDECLPPRRIQSAYPEASADGRQFRLAETVGAQPHKRSNLGKGMAAISIRDGSLGESAQSSGIKEFLSMLSRFSFVAAN